MGPVLNGLIKLQSVENRLRAAKAKLGRCRRSVIIQENQAFTWNPSLRGTKSEDTVLASAKGLVMITRPMSYPAVAMKVDGISFVRPDILQKE